MAYDNLIALFDSFYEDEDDGLTSLFDSFYENEPEEEDMSPPVDSFKDKLGGDDEWDHSPTSGEQWRPEPTEEAPAEESGEQGDMAHGWDRGVLGMKAAGYGAVGLAGSALGIDDLRDWGFENYQ
jgi:hypothetical protein